MAIDLIRERPISIAQARARLIPQLNGKPVASTTVYRWIEAGVLSGDGERVQLEAVRFGRNLVTTEEAIARFLWELTRRARSTADQPLSNEPLSTNRA